MEGWGGGGSQISTPLTLATALYDIITCFWPWFCLQGHTRNPKSLMSFSTRDNQCPKYEPLAFTKNIGVASNIDIF